MFSISVSDRKAIFKFQLLGIFGSEFEELHGSSLCVFVLFRCFDDRGDKDALTFCKLAHRPRTWS